MIDKEILRKVMERACDNSSRIMKNLMPHGNDFDILLDFYKNIIFDHDFCKAFWGEKLVESLIADGYEFFGHDTKFTKFKKIPNWEYHLARMVLEEEPLKYLEKFLPVEVS